MYQDRDSIKIFEAIHARDQFLDSVRKLSHGEKTPVDADLFAAHASIEGKESFASNALIIAIALIVLFGGIALFFTLGSGLITSR